MRLANQSECARVAEAETALALAKAELAQLLAGVNPAQIEEQQAAVDAARIEAKYAARDFQRQQGLFEAKGISIADRDSIEKELHRKEAALHQAEAELTRLKEFVQPQDRALIEAKVRQAEARLMTARAEAAETELHAPFDGTVLEVLQREGNSAYSTFAEPVLVFGDLSRLRVRAEFDQTYALRLKRGQKAVVCTRDEGRTEFEGAVEVVKSMMGNKTVFTKAATERKDLDVRQVLIGLNPAAQDLPVGLEVDVRVLAGAPEMH
jgi:HlyD family secretion protein